MSKLQSLSRSLPNLLLRQRKCAPVEALRCASGSTSADKVTHTGQRWDADDYRQARFVDKTKYVNSNFAVNLIAEIPPKVCKSRVVSCDGGGGPTGHPKVYINLDKPGNHSCGYCGLRFELDHCH